MKFQVDIKQLLLNNVATVHAEDLTQMYSYNVQQKSALGNSTWDNEILNFLK